MFSAFDAYLARLRKRLRRLPAQEADDHVSEIRSHLKESAASLAKEGCAAPQVEALKRIGSDRLVAENLMRTHSGIADKPAWRLAWVPLLVLLVGDLIPQASSEIPAVFFGVYSDYLIWFTWIAAVLFFIACFRSRRWLAKPVIAALAFAMITSVVLFAFGPAGVTAHSADERARDISAFDSYIANLDRKMKQAQVAIAGGNAPYESGNLWVPTISDTVSMARSNLWPIETETGREKVGRLIPVTGQAEARTMWQDAGTPYLEKLRADLEEQRKLRQDWKTIPHGWHEVWKSAAYFGFAYTLMFAAMLAINGLALGAARTRSILIERRWRSTVA